MIGETTVSILGRVAIVICCLTGFSGLTWSQSESSVSGRVLEAGSGQPVKEASVTITPLSGGQRLETATDGTGVYRFAEVKGGQYRLTVNKAGYDRNAFHVGRHSCSKTLTLTVGQALTNVDCTLDRAGVITGSVRDAENQPVAGVEVSALTTMDLAGKKWIYRAGASARTDDRGQYRLHDLPRGRYFVKVAQPSQDAAFRPRAEAPKEAKGHAGYITTYYPGVENLTQAVPVSLDSGREISGIDLRLLKGELWAVSGRVELPTGGAQVPLTMVWLEPLDGLDSEAPHTTCNQAGLFRFAGVRPGQYRLTAYDIAADTMLAGTMELTLTDDDRQTLVIPLSPPLTVNGALHLEDGNQIPDDLARAARIRLIPERQEPGVPRPDPGEITSKGRFSIVAPSAGRYRVVADGLPDSYLIGQVRYGTLDLEDGAFFHLAPGASLDITASSNGATIVATVRTSDGDPLAQAFVIAERDRIGPSGGSVRIPLTADQQGVARASGLLPGSYRLYAFEGGDVLSARSLDLSQYTGTAVDVTARGQTRVEIKALATQP